MLREKGGQEDIQSLEMAINLDNLEKAKELIVQGVDLNIRNDRGDTPLLQAIKTRKLSFVEPLISGGGLM